MPCDLDDPSTYADCQQTYAGDIEVASGVWWCYSMISAGVSLTRVSPRK